MLKLAESGGAWLSLQSSQFGAPPLTPAFQTELPVLKPDYWTKLPDRVDRNQILNHKREKEVPFSKGEGGLKNCHKQSKKNSS